MKESETESLSPSVADLRLRFQYIEQRQVMIGRVLSAIAIGAAAWIAFELATRALGWAAVGGISAGIGGGFLVYQYLIRRIPRL